MNRVEQQNCFILKSQAYKETSSIHQVFTRDYGVISVISKGSRAKNSKNGKNEQKLAKNEQKRLKMSQK